MPFDVFTSFVIYAPPGTAVYHQLHHGWTVGDHLAAFQLDVLNWLRWAKTEDGQHNKNPPEPTPRPGIPTTSTEIWAECRSSLCPLRTICAWSPNGKKGRTDLASETCLSVLGLLSEVKTLA
jgi:hypothetical protein